jgi:hypothetical protein
MSLVSVPQSRPCTCASTATGPRCQCAALGSRRPHALAHRSTRIGTPGVFLASKLGSFTRELPCRVVERLISRTNAFRQQKGCPTHPGLTRRGRPSYICCDARRCLDLSVSSAFRTTFEERTFTTHHSLLTLEPRDARVISRRQACSCTAPHGSPTAGATRAVRHWPCGCWYRPTGTSSATVPPGARNLIGITPGSLMISQP